MGKASHPEAEVLLDALKGAGRHDLEMAGRVLETVGAVVVPDADALDVFAGGNGGRGANDGDQFQLSLDLDPQDTEAGLLAVEGDPFNGAGKAFDWGI